MSNKQDMLKIQTCVLRVNIHCEGCKHKVKKTLQKVEGVYKVSIDAEQGKVSVSGNVDPLLLIQKLEKSGKHAEFWGPQKGPPIAILSNHNQLKNIQFGNMKESSKSQKGGAQQQIPQQLLMMMNQKKGLKDERFMGKDPKSVKFKLPEEDEDEDDFDDDDEFDDDEFDDDDSEFDDDEFDEGFGAHHQPPSKVAPVGGGAKAKAKKSSSNDEGKGKKNGGKEKEKEKKGGKEKEKKKGGGGGIGIDMLLKGIMGKGGGKNGKKGEKDKKKGDGGGKDSKKNDGFALGNGKNGGTKGHGAPNNGGGKKSNDGWGKKGGDGFDGGMKLESKQHGFNVLNAGHKGGGGGGGHKGGGGGGGRNMDGMMGQMGNFPAVHGLPATPGMNPMGGFPGMGMGMGPGNNPYNQQQMAHMMMMMNQQREHGHEAYGNYPMAFARPQPTMGYGPPPPGTDQYTHMFSDENTDSCSIM